MACRGSLLVLLALVVYVYAVDVPNWSGSYTCHPSSYVEPKTYEEAAELVRTHQRVRASGLLHSFNDLACSQDLMLSTKAFNQVLDVDTEKMTVTVQAGMRTRDLLEYLSERGYTLPTFSYYIDQSIAGGISTNTHGSSTSWGPLSSLLRSVKMILADGTIRTIIADHEPDLMKAVRVSIGLLGVLLEVELTIIEQEVVVRMVDLIDEGGIFEDLRAAREDPLLVDEFNYFWFPGIQKIIKTTIARKHPSRTAKATINPSEALNKILTATVQAPKLESFLFHIFNSLGRNEDICVAESYLLFSFFTLNALPGKLPFSEALPTQSQFTTYSLAKILRPTYDQYEFALTFDRMEFCLAELFKISETDPSFRNGFRAAPLMRFVREEDGFLSITNGGPRFFINMDNYDAYQRGGVSPSFEKVKTLMRSDACQARGHYGKAGLFSPAQHGNWTQEDVNYFKNSFASTWPAFAAIANQLDPGKKFADVHNLFRT